nr:OsmC family protein [Govania unica]
MADDVEASQIVTVHELGTGKFVQSIHVGGPDIHFLADEPITAGGSGVGPNPYDLLMAALGACTSMTLRLYADGKDIPLEKVTVTLRHEKIHAEDCAVCETQDGMIDRILRIIMLDGPLTDEQREKLLEIANKCPVHRTLTGEVRIVTRITD